MCDLECLKVDLKGMKDDETSLVFNLDESYFSALDQAEVKKGSLHVSVSIRKASGFFELLIHSAGTLIIPCDRCLDPVELPLDFNEHLVINLVPTMEETSTEDDDIWMINENDSELDLFHFIYESILLALPQQIVHPDVDGKPSCNPEMIKILDDLSSKKPETDPRWEALKNIKLD